MKTCNGCIHAKWRLTTTGRLHPSGEGQCTKRIKIPALPACQYWPGGIPPRPTGGSISRRQGLDDHCVYWESPKPIATDSQSQQP